MTPERVANFLGISPMTLRRWLRKNYLHEKGARWYLNKTQVIAAVREYM